MWTLATTIACAILLGYALAWAHDRVQRKAFEATLTEAERAQFHLYRLALPWRGFANAVEIGRAETFNRLVDTQRALRARREAIQGSKSIQDNLDLGGISSLTERVRALREEIRAAKAA
jgi:hypothetical protein